MNILITGGAGYIGSNMAYNLVEENFNVTVLDNLASGFLENLPPQINFVQADLKNIESIEKVFLNNRFDAVIHFAASISVEESVMDPLLYYQNNTVNTSNLINICAKHNVKNFIFSSTASVYGEGTKFPFLENDSLKPINPYGMSKLLGEELLIKL